MTGGFGDFIDDVGIRLARTIRASMTGSGLARPAARLAAPAGASSGGDGFGFLCRCGSAGGPWPSQGEAECLASIHDRLQHGCLLGAGLADVVPARALPGHPQHSRPIGCDDEILTADSGLSVGGPQR